MFQAWPSPRDETRVGDSLAVAAGDNFQVESTRPEGNFPNLIFIASERYTFTRTGIQHGQTYLAQRR